MATLDPAPTHREPRYALLGSRTGQETDRAMHGSDRSGGELMALCPYTGAGAPAHRRPLLRSMCPAGGMRCPRPPWVAKTCWCWAVGHALVTYCTSAGAFVGVCVTGSCRYCSGRRSLPGRGERGGNDTRRTCHHRPVMRRGASCCV